MTFQPGESGNPAGRPPGARNKKALAVEALLDDESEEVMRKLIGLAKVGDEVALRLCVDRMLPRRRERPVPLQLPRIRTDDDVRAAIDRITEALGEGEVTPREAADLLKFVDGASWTLQSSDVVARLDRIETRIAQILTGARL
jgi:hypothetical protein